MSNAYRIFQTWVRRTERISPNFIRVTLTGPQLADCGTTVLDQRVKLIFTGGRVEFDLGDNWHDSWLALPNESRPPMRTYTLRDARPGQAEVDIDFACHGDAGPASSFAPQVGASVTAT